MGLTKDCSRKELKKRYVEMSKQYHPDAFKSMGELNEDEAKKRFQEINEAYRMLMKKYSKPKRVLVQTRGYKLKDANDEHKVDEETGRTKSESHRTGTVDQSSEPQISNDMSHKLNLFFFLFIATLTIQLIVKEESFLNSRRIIKDEDAGNNSSAEIAGKKYTSDKITYLYLGLPLLLLYWKYWNRFGRY